MLRYNKFVLFMLVFGLAKSRTSEIKVALNRFSTSTTSQPSIPVVTHQYTLPIPYFYPYFGDYDYDRITPQWCRRILGQNIHPSHPYDSTLLYSILNRLQIRSDHSPQYQSLWYRNCYLPYREIGLSGYALYRGLATVNNAYHEALNTANNANRAVNRFIDSFS